jgi:hypothetical protein
MEGQDKQKVEFENVWKKSVPAIEEQVVGIWKNFGGLNDAKIEERLDQLVFVVKNNNHVVGVSTAFKTYIQQLRNYFYVYRCLITPGNNIPGIDAKLTVLTRDFLELIHDKDNRAAGLLTLIENPKLKERTCAVWPASGFVYIGNSKSGGHIRVYYFKGARIQP